MQADKPITFVEDCYQQMRERLKIARKQLKGRPLTLSEKILFSHLFFPKKFKRREKFLLLKPDRVIMQDVTAQMALLQFMLTGKDSVKTPTSIHCDHLIVAKKGEKSDMKEALTNNKEVFDFLSSAGKRWNIAFHPPSSGIIHQVVLENYSFPGALFIGTDSHTPNAGGLASLAVGVGGADAVDVMAGWPWELKRPRVTGVHLKGKLSGWASPKDVILKLLGILTVKGGTGKVIEYFGPGASSISCTGKATISNMGAELGATSSIFPYDLKMREYLSATNREDLARLADQFKAELSADREVLDEPKKYYDELIEIDLSHLEPHIAGPHSPDRVRPLRELKEEIQKEAWPARLSSALIGSCTNSSYEDMGRVASLIRQALKIGIKMPQPFLISPGSALIKQTIERDGYMEDFQKAGGLVLSNACGPCIGQWKRDIKKGQTNTILSSFNRNFKGRNDANPETLSFIASPETVTALALSGRLDFNPEREDLIQGDKRLRLSPPEARELPAKLFAVLEELPPPLPQTEKIEIKIRKDSQRLKALSPFVPWDGEDFSDLLVLCKVRGKCTTDHISPAGFWLKYRGHLDKISDNMLSGALNDWTGETGRGQNIFNQKTAPFAEIARSYKQKGQGWMIVGSENYGEGSSREHAAMSPRHLGAKAVLVKSFARIHETNLKKQGVLPLCFMDPRDFEKFQPEDRVSIKGLSKLKPESRHEVWIRHRDGSLDKIFVKHSLNSEQINWFKAGSSLNFLRSAG